MLEMTKYVVLYKYQKIVVDIIFDKYDFCMSQVEKQESVF